MAGFYKGVQARISKINAYALFSNCAVHSLNLSGGNAADSCQDAITFFGALQQLYEFLSKSPLRWKSSRKKYIVHYTNFRIQGGQDGLML